MKPIRTNQSNFVYRGPTVDIGDAWVERRPEHRTVYLVWELNDDERAEILEGGQLKLGIHGMEPIPPVSLRVCNEPVVDTEAPIPGGPDPFDGNAENRGLPGLGGRYE